MSRLNGNGRNGGTSDIDITLGEQAAAAKKIKALHVRCAREILKEDENTTATFRMDSDEERRRMREQANRLAERFDGIGRNGSAELLACLGIFLNKEIAKEENRQARLKKLGRG